MFGLGLLIFLVYAVVYKLMTSDAGLSQSWLSVGFIIMIACGLASVVLFAKANEVGQEATKRKPQDLPFNRVNQRALDRRSFEPVPTVTDRTTELLTVEKRDAKSR